MASGVRRGKHALPCAQHPAPTTISSTKGSIFPDKSGRLTISKSNASLLSKIERTRSPFDILISKSAFRHTHIKIKGNPGHFAYSLATGERVSF